MVMAVVETVIALTMTCSDIAKTSSVDLYFALCALKRQQERKYYTFAKNGYIINRLHRPRSTSNAQTHTGS